MRHSTGCLSYLNLRNIGARIILSCVHPLNFTSATSSGLIHVGLLFVYGTESRGQKLLFVLSPSITFNVSFNRSKSKPLPQCPIKRNFSFSSYAAKINEPK